MSQYQHSSECINCSKIYPRKKWGTGRCIECERKHKPWCHIFDIACGCGCDCLAEESLMFITGPYDDKRTKRST